MTIPQTNPLDYPRYVRGIRPALPESLPAYVEDELEKLSNSMENLAFAADANTATQVSVEATERQDADSALASLITTVEADLGDANARIDDEIVARVDGDGALASDIETVSTTVDGHTATITSHQSSLDGISLKYSVTLDVDGYASGFRLINEGAPGSTAFIIAADKFAVGRPGGGTDYPFEISGGVTYIKQANIKELSFDKLLGGTLAAGEDVVQDADWNVGDGRIIFDNGSVMKVQGLGFGSSDQFIEWFGPSLADFADCTEANAISYLTTSGDAYFGGSLSAGTLTNKVTSTNTADTAEAETGVFGSNGGTIVVVLSLSYSSGGETLYAPSALASFNTAKAAVSPAPTETAPGVWESGGSSAGTTTVELYRSINGGAYALVATLNTTGTWTWSGIEPNGVDPGRVDRQAHISGSLTYTDPATLAQDRQYKAVMTARSAQYAETITQRITIVAVEE